MSGGVIPTRIGSTRPLTTMQSSVGVVSGDDIDWDTSPVGAAISPDDAWKLPVRCATTASITIATALNAGDAIDGVTLADGDRVLVKNQGTASQNGIYVAGTTPTRAPDMDVDSEVPGALVMVIDGTQAGRAWRATNVTPPVIDADAITWTEFGIGITVEDEGTPLATTATTLNFVGSGVSATGSGATKTITVSGASPFFDVRDYGAVCDNSTDDTSAIQAALDAIASAGGSTLYLPGMSAISATLTYIDSGLKVFGGGSRYVGGGVRMVTANTTAFLFAPVSGTANRVRASQFQNVVIAGPGGASSGYGIDARNDLHVEGCFIYGFYDGVHLSAASYYSYIAHSTFTDCDRAGVYLDSCNNTTIDTCRFTGLFSSGSAPIGAMAYGVYAYSPSVYGLGHRVVNSSIEYFTADGIYLDGGRACSIEGNYFESQQSSAGHAHILVGPNSARVVSALRIAGNYLQGDGTSGFSAVKSTYLSGLMLDSNYRGINAAIPYVLDATNTSRVVILNDTESPAASDTLPATTYVLDTTYPPINTGATAGGDLANTYPNPSVAAIAGVAISGTPASGQVITATSSSAASWQSPAVSTGGTLLVADVHSTPIVFGDLLQNEATDDLLYAG